MNNFIAKMETGEKIQHLLEYQSKKITDFEDGLEAKFEKRVERLENDRYRSGYYLSLDDLVGLIDNITKTDKNHIEKLNIFFDQTVRRFRLYRSKEWESYLEEIGAKELVGLIKSYYLNTYEIYLIRNLHCDEGTLNRVKLKDHLEIYYQFISIFDLVPHIQDFSDEEIVGHCLVENTNQHLAERYLDLYYQQKKMVKTTEANRIKRRIINIVKQNTVHNITELNQAILEILKVDQQFKNELVDSRKLPCQ
jgi:hypothetical protein